MRDLLEDARGWVEAEEDGEREVKLGSTRVFCCQSGKMSQITSTLLDNTTTLMVSSFLRV